LKDLLVRTEGNRIAQTGTMHRFIDIPFEMTAELTIDADPSDPVDFYVDYCPTQLVAGYHVTARNDLNT
jgi:hypothetical protein